ncbi:hypothetical protein [Parafrankia sp. CH37]|uniref:hypothetical protein n=1 Tax=Parafrankia sp. CH37 TaxID=683308 RepID=UPI001866D05D|nr:hypothetical protein [Parafrankia sp. CH37]MBE3202279.1 hypothetical protein [Parafrankia sp. CH37]
MSKSWDDAIYAFTGMRVTPAETIVEVQRLANVLRNSTSKVDQLSLDLIAIIRAVKATVDSRAGRRFVGQTAQFVVDEPKLLPKGGLLLQAAANMLDAQALRMDLTRKQGEVMFYFMQIQLAIAAIEAAFGGGPAAAERIATTRTIIQMVLSREFALTTTKITGMQMLFMPGSSIIAQIWQILEGKRGDLDGGEVWHMIKYGLAAAASSVVAVPGLHNAMNKWNQVLVNQGVRGGAGNPIADLFASTLTSILLESGGGYFASGIVDGDWSGKTIVDDIISGTTEGSTESAARGIGRGARNGIVGPGGGPDVNGINDLIADLKDADALNGNGDDDSPGDSPGGGPSNTSNGNPSPNGNAPSNGGADSGPPNSGPGAGPPNNGAPTPGDPTGNPPPAVNLPPPPVTTLDDSTRPGPHPVPDLDAISLTGLDLDLDDNASVHSNASAHSNAWSVISGMSGDSVATQITIPEVDPPPAPVITGYTSNPLAAPVPAPGPGGLDGSKPGPPSHDSAPGLSSPPPVPLADGSPLPDRQDGPAPTNRSLTGPGPLDAPPVPAPLSTPGPDTHPSPSPQPTPTPSPQPTPTPTPTPTPEPLPSPAADAPTSGPLNPSFSEDAPPAPSASGPPGPPDANPLDSGSPPGGAPSPAPLSPEPVAPAPAPLSPESLSPEPAPSPPAPAPFAAPELGGHPSPLSGEPLGESGAAAPKPVPSAAPVVPPPNAPPPPSPPAPPPPTPIPDVTLGPDVTLAPDVTLTPPPPASPIPAAPPGSWALGSGSDSLAAGASPVEITPVGDVSADGPSTLSTPEARQPHPLVVPALDPDLITVATGSAPEADAPPPPRGVEVDVLHVDVLHWVHTGLGDSAAGHGLTDDRILALYEERRTGPIGQRMTPRTIADDVVLRLQTGEWPGLRAGAGEPLYPGPGHPSARPGLDPAADATLTHDFGAAVHPKQIKAGERDDQGNLRVNPLWTPLAEFSRNHLEATPTGGKWQYAVAEDGTEYLGSEDVTSIIPPDELQELYSWVAAKNPDLTYEQFLDAISMHGHPTIVVGFDPATGQTIEKPARLSGELIREPDGTFTINDKSGRYMSKKVRGEPTLEEIQRWITNFAQRMTDHFDMPFTTQILKHATPAPPPVTTETPLVSAPPAPAPREIQAPPGYQAPAETQVPPEYQAPRGDPAPAGPATENPDLITAVTGYAPRVDAPPVSEPRPPRGVEVDVLRWVREGLEDGPAGRGLSDDRILELYRGRQTGPIGRRMVPRTIADDVVRLLQTGDWAGNRAGAGEPSPPSDQPSSEPGPSHQPGPSSATPQSLDQILLTLDVPEGVHEFSGADLSPEQHTDFAGFAHQVATVVIDHANTDQPPLVLHLEGGDTAGPGGDGIFRAYLDGNQRSDSAAALLAPLITTHLTAAGLPADLLTIKTSSRGPFATTAPGHPANGQASSPSAAEQRQVLGWLTEAPPPRTTESTEGSEGSNSPTSAPASYPASEAASDPATGSEDASEAGPSSLARSQSSQNSTNNSEQSGIEGVRINNRGYLLERVTPGGGTFIDALITSARNQVPDAPLGRLTEGMTRRTLADWLTAPGPDGRPRSHTLDDPRGGFYQNVIRGLLLDLDTADLTTILGHPPNSQAETDPAALRELARTDLTSAPFGHTWSRLLQISPALDPFGDLRDTVQDFRVSGLVEAAIRLPELRNTPLFGPVPEIIAQALGIEIVVVRQKPDGEITAAAHNPFTSPQPDRTLSLFDNGDGSYQALVPESAGSYYDELRDRVLDWLGETTTPSASGTTTPNPEPADPTAEPATEPGLGPSPSPSPGQSAPPLPETAAPLLIEPAPPLADAPPAPAPETPSHPAPPTKPTPNSSASYTSSSATAQPYQTSPTSRSSPPTTSSATRPNTAEHPCANSSSPPSPDSWAPPAPTSAAAHPATTPTTAQPGNNPTLPPPNSARTPTSPSTAPATGYTAPPRAATRSSTPSPPARASRTRTAPSDASRHRMPRTPSPTGWRNQKVIPIRYCRSRTSRSPPLTKDWCGP